MIESKTVIISNEPLISLNKATLSDLKFINDLQYNEMDSILSVAWKGGFRWSSWFEDIEKAIEGTHHLVYVIQESEINIGYLWMNVDSATLWIAAIILKQGWQRKKIGSMILRYLIGRCKNSGINAIELGVQQNNQKALDFYKSHGFKKFDQLRHASTDLLRLTIKDQN